MLIIATLQKPDGKIMGTKSVPENCLALRYGGATFVRVAKINSTDAIYQQTDTYHFNILDDE